MNEVDPRVLREFCQSLKIVNQGTGTVTYWRLNDEQRAVIETVCKYGRVIILKSRQVGVSTILLAYDLLFALANPGLPISLCLDTDENAKALLGRMQAWARQLGVPLRKPTDEHHLTLWNGATIRALTAGSRAAEGESRTGRSGSSALIHASELAFWATDAATFSALTSTAFPSAKIIVESTASAAQNLYRTMWDRAVAPPDDTTPVAGRYRALFLPLELHHEYRLDPRTISDELWQRLRAEGGFTRRDTAAWWWSKLQSDFAGDLHRCLQEYPVKAEDAFSFGKGRWIFGFHSVEPAKHVGDWRLYLEKPEEPVILGVDTARGVGRDSSAIAIIGQGSGALVATYKCNTISIADFAREVFQAQRIFKAVATCVETNGVGKECYVELSARGLPGLTDQKSSDIRGEKDVRMGWVKRGIESGRILAGPELKAEIEGSIRTEEGDWEGPDDLLNAISFAEKWRLANPWKPPSARPNRHKVYVPKDDADTSTVY
jgi:hypothetical protein